MPLQYLEFHKYICKNFRGHFCYKNNPKLCRVGLWSLMVSWFWTCTVPYSVYLLSVQFEIEVSSGPVYCCHCTEYAIVVSYVKCRNSGNIAMLLACHTSCSRCLRWNTFAFNVGDSSCCWFKKKRKLQFQIGDSMNSTSNSEINILHFSSTPVVFFKWGCKWF